jgi:hypothetical protein
VSSSLHAQARKSKFLFGARQVVKGYICRTLSKQQFCDSGASQQRADQFASAVDQQGNQGCL